MVAKAAGHNPMRWDCDRDGCFNALRRPKIEVFAECFPRRINFGDVDGMVELNGRFCLLEWKGEGGSIRTGQRIAYERFSALPGNVVFVVNGDAKTMGIESYCCFWAGSQGPWTPANIESLKDRIRQWVKYTERKCPSNT